MRLRKWKQFNFLFLKKNIIDNYLEGRQNITIDEIYLNIGSYLIEVMTTLKLIDTKIYSLNKQSTTYALLTPKVKDLLNTNINRAISIPFDLPMIVKPKDCGDKTSGGYLLNDIEYHEPLINKKIFYDKPSEIEVDNKIYFSLNKMMGTAYKVNKELLDYLTNFNHIHKLLIEPDHQHEYANIAKRDKYQEKEYQSYLSKKLLQEYIIKIAQTYSNVPEIYFPIRLDQRGRLYPRPIYFHYQSSELAKALLQFANPDYINREDIKSIEYLKAFGANCFGNGLNKKSYIKRVE
jgi:DNA-directed RNA polymerase